MLTGRAGEEEFLGSAGANNIERRSGATMNTRRSSPTTWKRRWTLRKTCRSSIGQSRKDSPPAGPPPKNPPAFHVLENETVMIGGVRFLGATLWTDFRLHGAPEPAMVHARRRMNDYRQIAWQKKPWQRFLPVHSLRLHEDSKA